MGSARALLGQSKSVWDESTYRQNDGELNPYADQEAEADADAIDVFDIPISNEEDVKRKENARNSSLQS